MYRGPRWVDWGSRWVRRSFYQHIGIGNAKSLHWGSAAGARPTRDPNVREFALQWNIGFEVCFRAGEDRPLDILLSNANVALCDRR